MGEGYTRKARGAMGEGCGRRKGFGERAKGREVVAGRRDGRRQEVGVRGAERSTGRRQDWGSVSVVMSEWAGARLWREQVAGRQEPPAAARGEVALRAVVE